MFRAKEKGWNKTEVSFQPENTDKSELLRQSVNNLLSPSLAGSYVSIRNGANTEQLALSLALERINNVYALTLQELGQSGAALRTGGGNGDDSNILSSCGGQILAESNNLLIGLSVLTLNSDENQLLVLAGICGGNLIAFALMLSGNDTGQLVGVFGLGGLIQSLHLHM